jgi:bifunctional NMN adenylyltransferase/nudix hydrolase
MNKSYDFLVFIGRFQPFHAGHLAVIQAGLTQAERVIILPGSAHQPRSVRNPWTVAEREAMIRSALTADENARVLISPLMDQMYNDDAWVRNVQATVNGLVTAHHPTPHKPARVGLIGHSKDASSYYLNLFPQWGSVQVDNYQSLSATPIREALLRGERLIDGLPPSVVAWLNQWTDSEDFAHIQQEANFVEQYKSAWSAAPYAPTFVTVDAVVVQSGHILMIKRKARPGRGLWALPGGFVDQGETLLDACLRELKEETRLKVPLPVLKGSVVSQQVFDDPYRSARGRTITHAYLIELAPNAQLPKVKGGDDAKSAHWIPFAELNPVTLFEDHYFIIQQMLGM